ncbi:MAG: YqeG family HAD IIIA-type phosphatase [Peptococcaceae bacterium]|nr:YqeG family HAD IIIA-type phosphatase [Peptococcaceae bacterium]
MNKNTIRILRPDFQYESLKSIPVEDLVKNGIKGLLLDLDNTISPWNDRTLSSEVVNWFQKIKAQGIKACIVSNNRHPDRVAAVADILGIQYVYQAAKPRKKGFGKGLKHLGLGVGQVAVVGDQLLTDVLGGKRMGMKTILLMPIDEREFGGTKVLRFLERLCGRKTYYTRKFARQGMVARRYHDK